MAIRCRGPFVFAVMFAAAACAGACAAESSPTGFPEGDGGASSSSGSGGSSGASSGSSSGKGSSTGGGSGSGGNSSSSGSGSSGSSSSGSGSTSSGSGSSGGDAGCSASIANGALPLMSNYLAGSVIGDGGYAYAYDDKNGSSACLDSTAYCTSGTTGIANGSIVWGAGVGSSLNQAMAMNMQQPPINPYAVTGSGVSYTLDNYPSQGMRMIIDEGGTDYCAPLSGASGTVKWASFNTKCWDNSGTTLSGAPQTATHLQFQVTAGMSAGSFSFCVTALSFAP